MCQKPMKFTLHQMEQERKAALKAKNEPEKILSKLFRTIGVRIKSNVLVNGKGKLK
ncbi:hypothetical protein [Neobacillus vireti]|uniref:hypothetical protein n=1 Tax=Neobacillus vireti TaxID=220686 RepID=UPI002FFD594D